MWVKCTRGRRVGIHGIEQPHVLLLAGGTRQRLKEDWVEKKVPSGKTRGRKCRTEDDGLDCRFVGKNYGCGSWGQGPGLRVWNIDDAQPAEPMVAVRILRTLPSFDAIFFSPSPEPIQAACLDATICSNNGHDPQCLRRSCRHRAYLCHIFYKPELNAGWPHEPAEVSMPAVVMSPFALWCSGEMLQLDNLLGPVSTVISAAPYRAFRPLGRADIGHPTGAPGSTVPHVSDKTFTSHARCTVRSDPYHVAKEVFGESPEIAE